MYFPVVITRKYSIFSIIKVFRLKKNIFLLLLSFVFSIIVIIMKVSRFNGIFYCYCFVSFPLLFLFIFYKRFSKNASVDFFFKSYS